MSRRPTLNRRSVPAVVAGVATAVLASCATGGTAAPVPGARQAAAHLATVPKGWKISVFARVPGARLAVWAPDHRLLVSRPGYGDVVAVAQNGRVSTAVSGLRQPHGIAFHNGTLYVAESNQIDTFHYANGRATRKHVLIGRLPDAKSPELGGQYAHALKSVVVGRTGTVYFSVGSTGNISANDRAAHPQRATILQYRNGRVSVFARGVRNGTGLAIDFSGSVWTAVNNRDQIPYPYARDWDGDGSRDTGKVMQSFVNDHPMEEIAKLYPGRDLGWPYCNPDPDTKLGVRNSPKTYANRRLIHDWDTNRNGRVLNCGKLKPIEQGLPAHSAPLGMSFATIHGLGRVALVATHGSWNRTPPRAPTVSAFPWRNGQLGARRVLVGGFQNARGDRSGRPVAAVRSPWSTSIYITDDQAGVVYRLTPPA